MSYDIVFLPESARDDWAGAMDNLEMHAMMDAAPSDEDVASWDRLGDALTADGVAFDRIDADEERTYTLVHPTIEISLRPGDVRIAVPYQADLIDELDEALPRIVHLTEDATGRVAYDPQSDRAFFSPENHPRDVIQSVCELLAERETAGDTRAERRGVLRRFFGRHHHHD